MPLPGPGNSSPIVSHGRVFLTCAEETGRKRHLYCFHRASGDPPWRRTVNYPKKMKTHKTNPYCASTPAANGRQVVVWHGSAGLFCYDFSGKELWKNDLGEVIHNWGYAASPVLYGDRIILNRGPGKDTAMMALELESGKIIWKTKEPLNGDGKFRKDGNNIGTWSTPIIVKIDGRDQIVCSMPTRVVA
ncbi:MAG: PQQ-binding-like beta-propeller repeat protein, partial [Planctomycetes bacterium]|nr:PQQ-binding-like beta-propeller repeat protein [Planctomycetota bacterium]